jgi:hypothetical protein
MHGRLRVVSWTMFNGIVGFEFLVPEPWNRLGN